MTFTHTSRDLDAFFAGLDSQIREGKSGQARREIQELWRTGNHRHLPRNSLPPLASYARRVGIPGLAVKLLNPWVRGVERRKLKSDHPLPREKLEYGVALTQIGGLSEGRRILQSLYDSGFPEVNLYLAFCEFAIWDYRAAVPLLTRYLRAPGLGDYERLVGKLNLLAARVLSHDLDQAEADFQEIAASAKAQNSLLILGNAHEVLAQARIFTNQWADAERLLAKARNLLEKVGTYDSLFVAKWEAILSFKKNKTGAEKQLKEIRRRAHEIRHWETLRDCDFHIGLLANNAALLEKVYRGTYFVAYRERIRQIAPDLVREIEGRDYYAWTRGDHTALQIADMRNASTCLKEGFLVDRLFRLFCSDFYAPFRLASVHDQLFPKEFYNPESSPVRIRQLVSRLNTSLGEFGPGFRILRNRGAYEFAFPEDTAVITKAPTDNAHSKIDFVIRQVLKHFNSEELFSAREVSSKLGISMRSANRALAESKRSGKITQVGAGWATRFKINV